MNAKKQTKVVEYLPRYHDSLLRWFERHGRHDLPWQRTRSENTAASQNELSEPYPVWVSEIMLQQTQVQTVIPHFNRFMQRFPTLQSLATSSEEAVLHAWSGLGYYQRARNLHKTARLLQSEYHCLFPRDLQTLQSLPGIGRSTAGAIASLCFGASAPILDGNVKRVLSRLYTLDQPPGVARDKTLWQLSTHHTPREDAARYNQAMMDLGATVCTVRSPLCQGCPLSDICRAARSSSQAQYPVTKTAAALPQKFKYLLIIENDTGDILLEKRPPRGIWPALWSLPEAGSKAELGERLGELGAPGDFPATALPSFTHRFSHYVLVAQPMHLRLGGRFEGSVNAWHLSEVDKLCWYSRTNPPQIGIPKPIRTLLHGLTGKQPPATMAQNSDDSAA